MSNDVVISKELRDRILGLLSILPFKGPATDGYAAELRAAPETVSLEGVERWSEGASDFGLYRSFDGDWVGFSDLRRLITPVQPSAVVSRDKIDFEIRSHLGAEQDTVDAMLRHQLGSAIYALQLPKPQTAGRVALSGVQRWTFNQTHMRKHFDGEFVRVSDLRRLVAPVQGGGGIVPKDEDSAYLRFSEWLAWCGYPEYNTKKTWAVLAEEYADRIIKGWVNGVDWPDLASEMIRAKGRHMGGRNLDEPGKELWGEDEYVSKELLSWLAHLTAPQPASPVPTVDTRITPNTQDYLANRPPAFPSVGEVLDCIHDVQSGRDTAQGAAEAIHQMMTARLKGETK